ncbi:MAG TPA: hypothetical protein VGG37_05335 [Opitutaceae bacterium]|jgi:hypothetical protein
MNYHAAYNYLSLKGVLAERWAHGPVFGAMADQGNQVTLTPEGGFKDDRVDAIYGLRGSSFDRELIEDEKATYEQAGQWLNDVLAVLKPKRVTRLVAHWFALYPLSNKDAALAANRRLKVHYFRDGVDALQPQDYEANFSAVSGGSTRGDLMWSYEFGIVGPQHKGAFFGVADDDRDSRWWMGLKFNLNRSNDDGIDEPSTAIEALLQEGAGEYERLVQAAMSSIF